MERQELEQLFAFNRWANRQTIEALRSLDPAPEKLRDLLRHTLSATDNWLSSIGGTKPLDWDEPNNLDAVATYLERIEAKSVAFVQALSEAGLREGFKLRDTSGVRFPIVVGDVLQHVILHGVEHRAQIMYEVGALGGEPVELQYARFISERPDSA